jgi:hypothetical protein
VIPVNSSAQFYELLLLFIVDTLSTGLADLPSYRVGSSPDSLICRGNGDIDASWTLFRTAPAPDTCAERRSGIARPDDVADGRAGGRGAVLSMALCVMVLIASEFMPVSLLTPIASDLRMTEGLAGQAISISGVFAVLTSLVIAGVTARLDRRTVRADGGDHSAGHHVGRLVGRPAVRHARLSKHLCGECRPTVRAFKAGREAVATDPARA